MKFEQFLEIQPWLSPLPVELMNSLEGLSYGLVTLFKGLCNLSLTGGKEGKDETNWFLPSRKSKPSEQNFEEVHLDKDCLLFEPDDGRDDCSMERFEIAILRVVLGHDESQVKKFLVFIFGEQQLKYLVNHAVMMGIKKMGMKVQMQNGTPKSYPPWVGLQFERVTVRYYTKRSDVTVDDLMGAVRVMRTSFNNNSNVFREFYQLLKMEVRAFDRNSKWKDGKSDDLERKLGYFDGFIDGISKPGLIETCDWDLLHELFVQSSTNEREKAIASHQIGKELIGKDGMLTMDGVLGYMEKKIFQKLFSLFSSREQKVKGSEEGIKILGEMVNKYMDVFQIQTEFDFLPSREFCVKGIVKPRSSDDMS